MEALTSNSTTQSPCEDCNLRHKFIFRSLSQVELKLLSKNLYELNYSPGEVIIKQGSSPIGYICLKKGKVKLTKLAPNGKEQIIDLKSAPDTVGIRALVSNSRYRSTATSIDYASICVVEKEYFNHAVKNNPSLAEGLMKYLADRLIKADQKQIRLTQKPIKARLAETLLELESFVGKDTEGFIDIPLKRSDLAQLSNMTTANAIRTLSGFQSEGLIFIDGRRIKVNKKEGLKILSEF